MKKIVILAISTIFLLTFSGFALAGDKAPKEVVEFDESEQEYLVHVWVPVKDGGQVIGVVDIGVEIED